jgi:hypothetical protein
MWFAVLAEGTLFMDLVKVADSWLWHSDMIGSKPELEISCFGELAVEKAKDRMENIVGGGEPIAWCG